MITTLLLSISGWAQKDSSGIYKTAKDFQNRKLSYAINYKKEKYAVHSIYDYVLFNDSIINVNHYGTYYTLRKSDTYGYRSVKGEEFRFVDNKVYKILNPGEQLLLYAYQHPFHSPKEAAKYPPVYFFSVDAVTFPQLLTIANLKAAFPNDHKFHNALNSQFKEDNQLYNYDSIHNMYKINWIFQPINK